jgi:multisubunit Na+/H+ antiporter MnhB subunit
MRKLLLIAATILMVTPALADYRHRRYIPPAPQHHHHRGINPWVAGAIGLGVLGAGTYYYNNYGRQCWDEPVMDRFGYQLYDQYGRPMVRRFCN